MDVSTIKELFFQRRDTFPIQTATGYTRIERELTDDDIKAHLEGKITLGAYNLGKDNKVRWICFDFDNENHKEDAKNL